MTETSHDKDDQAQASSLAAGRRRAPSRLVLVRHAQSLGNVANDRAHDEGLGRLVLHTRDADTPLSEDGKVQARALGDHLKSMPESERPQVILCSPYQRARETAQIALEHAGLDQRLVVDERLRERDLGVFDGLTRKGIEEEFPEEAERRTKEGKFYFRPAGGESWCDVALRVRSVLADIRAEYDDEQVWVFSHQAVIMAFRLVLEGMDEQSILKVDADDPLPNVSLTSYTKADDGSLELEAYARTTHVEASEAPVTRERPAAVENR